jgi:hypothetical protein
MVRVCAFCFRIGFRHVVSCLGLAIVVGPIAVVHITGRVHPYQLGTATHRRWSRRSLGRRRRLRSRRGRSGRRRDRSRSRLCRPCRSNRRRGGGIPLLHALVSAACSLFARCGRIGSIFALARRTSRGGCLRHSALRSHQPQRQHHTTNYHLHLISPEIRDLFRPQHRQILPHPLFYVTPSPLNVNQSVHPPNESLPNHFAPLVVRGSHFIVILADKPRQARRNR